MRERCEDGEAIWEKKGAKLIFVKETPLEGPGLRHKEVKVENQQGVLGMNPLPWISTPNHYFVFYHLFI